MIMASAVEIRGEKMAPTARASAAERLDQSLPSPAAM
jgi:hypothetical protein